MKNTKRNLNRYIILLTIVLSTISCTDFLYQEPDEQISIGEQFESKEGLLETVNGMYKSLEEFVSGNFFIYADMQGGNFTFLPSETNNTVSVPTTMENTYKFDDTEEDSEFEAQYEDIYSIVNQANLILENLYESPDTEDSLRQQIKAEMLAVRGFTHFIGSLMYSQNMQYTTSGEHLGIVYNRNLLQAGVDYPVRETKLQTYAYIKADLLEALSLFTENQALEYGPAYSYFNTITTQALLARVALDNADWSTAYNYADSVIKNTPTQLMDNASYESEWRKEGEAVSEAILEFSAPIDTDKDNSTAVSSSVANSYFSYDVANNVLTNYMSKGYAVSEDVIELYETNDVRLSLYDKFNIDTKVNGVLVETPYYFVGKFQDDPGTTFMRLSELYLIRAEAAYRMTSSNIATALEDLNTIRLRAGISELENSSSLDFLEEIFLERRRELACEGHMLYDLMRFKKSIVRNKGCLSSACGLDYPNGRYILPIPYSSIELNQNMIQNETY